MRHFGDYCARCWCEGLCDRASSGQDALNYKMLSPRAYRETFRVPRPHTGQLVVSFVVRHPPSAMSALLRLGALIALATFVLAVPTQGKFEKYSVHCPVIIVVSIHVTSCWPYHTHPHIPSISTSSQVLTLDRLQFAVMTSTVPSRSQVASSSVTTSILPSRSRVESSAATTSTLQLRLPAE